jgi:hypothetical protein
MQKTSCPSEHLCLCQSACQGYAEHNPGTLTKAKLILERSKERDDWTLVLKALMHFDDCPHYVNQLGRGVL